ncbi:hypothetical protein KGY77_10220 [Candidatus Bipolaricaulota bacterium]|nr:hypothetical protein [Candidatus Bipolaricaulota bacterium]
MSRARLTCPLFCSSKKPTGLPLGECRVLAAAGGSDSVGGADLTGDVGSTGAHFLYPVRLRRRLAFLGVNGPVRAADYNMINDDKDFEGYHVPEN